MKYQILNSYSGTAIMLSEAMPVVSNLYMLMKKNKKMIIRIEGHINDPANISGKDGQELSVDRADMVSTYLVDKGISKDRLSTIGYGSKKMLFPDPKSFDEMQRNRRVEINVISY